MEFFLEAYLTRRVKEVALTLPVFDATFDPEIRPADERFGDFQANGLLAYLGKRKENPRMWAQQLMNLFAAHDPLFDVAVAGPGFLNFSLKDTTLMRWLCKFHTASSYQGAYKSIFSDRTVVIDYSSPNTAKRMHVGHLRSMVIGEALQRLIRFGGGRVIRDNHIGDWGTQFGILLMQIKASSYAFNEDPEATIEALEYLYQVGMTKTKEDATALDQARQELVKLQQGDAENLMLWERINRLSYQSFDRIYQRMQVAFDHVLGESFYRNKVDDVYDELQKYQLAVFDGGALVVFHPEHPRFCKQAFLIRKSDGASNYASTDLATVKYRVQEFHADDIVYVTDCRQCDHFEQLFLTVKKWFQAADYRVPNMYHVYFGTILDAHGKAIKTREGRPIQLQSLLNEAVKRAYNLIQEKSPDLPEAEKRKVAEVVGLGAIKYADLLQERTGNYRFEWDKMINFDGNTAPYLLYAIARIYAIFRKLNLKISTLDFAALKDVQSFSTATERALAKKLIAFPSALNLALKELKPHWLCHYLFDLAGTFSAFYNADKVAVEDTCLRQSRLLLCSATLSTLETGLHLLGLETLERM
ncbi:MAG: arginine--tRNA ligase [Puniceicoccales bacterium]|jgi:arginyl-tRNA synthetase|nr:arginine--tRNA ligase [Puniceicoccales bacterium]